VCIWEAGKEVIQPAPVNSLRLRLRRSGLSISGVFSDFVNTFKKWPKAV